MQQNKLWVSVLSILVTGGLLLFVLSHLSHDRQNDALAASGEHATSFHIIGKGLAKPTSTNYVYRVVGPPGTTATITYTNQDGSHGTVEHAALPWSIATVTTDGPDLPVGAGQPPYVEAKINSHGHNAKVTCQAFGDGKLSDQETAIGSYVTISCGFPY
jgi:hypothetical protein